jgi:hypothetical protein
VLIAQRFSNCGVRRTLVDCMRDIIIWNLILVQGKIYILISSLLGGNILFIA